MLDGLIVVAIPIVAGTVYFSGIWAYRRILSWSISRRIEGLSPRHDGFTRLCMTGEQDGFTLTISRPLLQITASPVGAAETQLLIDVNGNGLIPPNLELGSETEATRARGHDILTDDQLFDHVALVTGSVVSALALLDQTTRDEVLSFLSRGGVVSKGRVRLYSPGWKLKEYVPLALELAKRLRVSKRDLADRLAANARGDRTPEVRARNFVALQQHYTGTPIARELVEEARSGHDPYLRLEAAILDRSRDRLGEMAAKTLLPPRLRVRALEQLAKASWAEVAIPVLEQLLDDKEITVRIAAVVALGRYRHSPSVDKLISFTTFYDARMKAAAATALGRIGDPAAEQALLSLLTHQESEVFEAAIKGLALLGTVAAVEPLRQTLRRQRKKARKESIESCIRMIQGRALGAEQGQLSIAAPAEPGGGLSLAEEQADGRLSLSEVTPAEE